MLSPRLKAILRRWRMMDPPRWRRISIKSDGSEVNTLTRLTRSDALWMINEMDWTPESFPESEGAVARNSFVEAIARFSLKAEINAARQRNAEAVVDPWVGTADTHGSSEAVVDLWVGTVEEGLAQMEIGNQPL